MQSPALQETCNNLEQTELVFTLSTLAGLPVLWELICIPGTSVRRLKPGTSRHKGAKKTVNKTWLHKREFSILHSFELLHSMGSPRNPVDSCCRTFAIETPFCNREKETWPHIVYSTFMLCLLCLVMLDLHLCKRILPIAWNRHSSPFSRLYLPGWTFKGVTLFIHMEITGCGTESNIILLEVYRNIVTRLNMDSCKNKEGCNNQSYLFPF